MLGGQRPPEDELYLRENNIPSIFHELQEALLKEKPANPWEFLSGAAKKMSELTRQRSETLQMQRQLSDVYTPQPQYPPSLAEKTLSIIVFGASGDLSRKKTLPALHSLFYNGLLPTNVLITGYNRSVLDLATFKSKIVFKKFPFENQQLFLSRLEFVSGSYDKEEDFARLDEVLKRRENGPANRLFYLALPPTMFVPVSKGINAKCFTQSGWNRVVVEKPFGRDTASSNALSKSLGSLFAEEQIFRIDHYLGKEMVQNLVALRFANKLFSSIWNRNCISNVQITFKEPFGTEGRGGYFDEFGIIRDVIQNHLLQIVALIAMDNPKTMDPEKIRDEKVALLRCIQPVTEEDTVIGQYVADPEKGKPGYLDDDTVPRGSNTPTFGTCVLKVNNDAWQDVPFIVKAGKALDGKYVVIRIQFRDQIQPFGAAAARNELVIRCQPDEAMYVKIMAKTPGMDNSLVQTELDLTYNTRFQDVHLPDAYESLIYDVCMGISTNFVRTDELEAAWRIFTPLLHKIDAGTMKSIPYKYGSRGPPEADALIKKYGFIRNATYSWEKSTKSKV
jgi:glucose-6-phosphate 1-dehydrogenase